MSFRSRRPPETPSLPQQLSAPELMDVIDEISGVQTVTVTGPDGRRRRVTQRLPLTPAEQQTLSQAENLINRAVTNIETLYRYDPTTVANYQPFIQAFSTINNERAQDLAQIGNLGNIQQRIDQIRNINRDLVRREFDNRERITEENLARRGLQRSTDAYEQRAALARERALAEQEADITAQNFGEDLATRQLSREADLYNIREQGRQGRLQEAELGYNLERQRQAELENARQNAINENLNFLNVGQSVQERQDRRAQLALAGNQNALGVFNAEAGNQNQRYANEVNRIQNQHAMDLNRFNSTPASFGRQLRDVALSTAGRAAGAYLTGGMSEIGRAASQASSSGGQSFGRNQAFGQLARLGR